MGSKGKKAKVRIIIFTLLFLVMGFCELYTMINYSSNYIVIVILLIVALAAAYVVIDGIMVMIGERNSKREQEFEDLLKSEKAIYLLQKKQFEDMEKMLTDLRDKSKIPSEEIINAQKGIAKVIINRNKENADAIINSNDQVLEHLEEIERLQKSIEIPKEAVLKDSIEMPEEAVSEDSIEMPEEAVSEESIEVPEEPVKEELPPMPDLSDPNKALSPDEIAALFASMSGGDTAGEEVTVEEIDTTEENVPPMPDLSDPNKVMSPDEIAALIANL